ncbi:MAG: DUF4469 domain-containing protein [Kiritimatiellae bacterium]|nr:DUF4469 domain-containing protein [Kiritimatiellia bacterium]
MATVQYVTAKGSGSISSTPFYVGLVQHERTMSRRESYETLAARTGYRATALRAVFMALAEYVRENAGRGNITYIDGVASIRNTCKGAFEGLAGPWTKGRNHLMVAAVELDPFKSVLGDLVPTNKTGGAKPAINTVFDDVTGVYDVITGTDAFSVAGSDLAVDATKPDEYVALVNARGEETRATVTFSDLQNVKAHLESALPAGAYTLKVCTRSGLGAEYGVCTATRKVTVG